MPASRYVERTRRSAMYRTTRITINSTNSAACDHRRVNQNFPDFPLYGRLARGGEG
jgi:hypothetical protein